MQGRKQKRQRPAIQSGQFLLWDRAGEQHGRSRLGSGQDLEEAHIAPLGVVRPGQHELAGESGSSLELDKRFHQHGEVLLQREVSHVYEILDAVQPEGLTGVPDLLRLDGPVDGI